MNDILKIGLLLFFYAIFISIKKSIDTPPSIQTISYILLIRKCSRFFIHAYVQIDTLMYE